MEISAFFPRTQNATAVLEEAFATWLAELSMHNENSIREPHPGDSILLGPGPGFRFRTQPAVVASRGCN